MQGSLMPKSFFLTLGCRVRSDRVSLANPGRGLRGCIWYRLSHRKLHSTSVCEANLGDLLRMHDEGNVQWTLACRFAQKALAEEQVFTWLKTQNLVHGAAPAALQVYEQFRLRQAHAAPGEPLTRRGIQKWVMRWRKRWSVRRGRLHVRDCVDPADLR